MLWSAVAAVGFVAESALVIVLGRSTTRRWERSVPVLPPPVSGPYRR
ncbi:hypothetical protein [Petropleomorpha daqingensis]|uniref:Uncharacterized protein n=1 Tax=Petropleomorpha daqingensis TaxID=2026353 RepID=A0A853CBE2_9ACTN|nr:hypothetical protein [Petropleomorpha daqingensis]NYJ04459.1 hypothetical protein [Petropleomorpha daqingensis]